jgi:hypothetical protein
MIVRVSVMRIRVIVSEHAQSYAISRANSIKITKTVL